MKKSTITNLLVSLLTLGALVGCGGSGTNYDPDNFLPNGTEDNPYRIVKEPVTILLIQEQERVFGIQVLPFLICSYLITPLRN